MRTPFASLALAAGLTFAAAGCSPNAFEVSLSGQTTVHGDPATAGAGLTRIPAIGSFASIDFPASEEFKQNQATKDAVQSIKVSGLKVQIQNPNSQGFDFLDELHFIAAAGSEEQEVAGKSGISELGLEAPNPTLNLDVSSSAELRDFLSAPSVSITARGSGRVPPQDTTLQATVKLRVVLKVF
jgi:hypothetical protein